MRHFYYTAITVIILPLFFVFPPAHAAYGSLFRVTEVNDGDTVTIRAKSFAGIPLKTERVRLIGIDAPELRQEPWGRRSKCHLKKLLSKSNWVVEVEYDIDRRDKYGRLLGYLWGRDGRMLNERQVEAGMAVPYTFAPNVKYVERFADAQKRAKARKYGFWKEGGLTEAPRYWRKSHPR
jgi:micrococcal nuclease